MKLYISTGAIGLLAIFYAPPALYLIWRLWRRLRLGLAARISICLGALFVAAAIPLWDVVITSVQMARLCPQAGIFVKRSVKVDGFYTNFGSPDMLKRGFRYIESRSYGDRIVVYRKDGDAVKTEEFDAKTYEIKSRYEYIYDAESGAYQGRRDIGIQKSVVRDRQTNEELGYALRYAAYPGWVDRNTVGLLGRVGWACEAHPVQDTLLVRQVLSPIE